jgi:hypothetical protein
MGGKQENPYNLDVYLRPCLPKRKKTGRSIKSKVEEGKIVVSNAATQLSVWATDGGFQFLYPDQNVRMDTLTPSRKSLPFYETFGLSLSLGAVGNFNVDSERQRPKGL